MIITKRVKRMARSEAYNMTFRYLKAYRDMKRSMNVEIANNLHGAFVQKMIDNRKETAELLQILDQAIAELEVEQEAKGEKYKVDAMKMHFFEGKSYEKIAEMITAGESTPRRWITQMVEIIAVKLFGKEALE